MDEMSDPEQCLPVAVRMITTSPPKAACQITINFTAINEIDISPELSAAHPYFDVYVRFFLIA